MAKVIHFKRLSNRDPRIVDTFVCTQTADDMRVKVDECVGQDVVLEMIRQGYQVTVNR